MKKYVTLAYALGAVPSETIMEYGKVRGTPADLLEVLGDTPHVSAVERPFYVIEEPTDGEFTIYEVDEDGHKCSVVTTPAADDGEGGFIR